MRFVKFVGRVLGVAVVSITANAVFKTFVQPKLEDLAAQKLLSKDTFERASGS